MLGINRFSDLTFDEFQTAYLMPSRAKYGGSQQRQQLIPLKKPPPLKKALLKKAPPPPPRKTLRPPPPRKSLPPPRKSPPPPRPPPLSTGVKLSSEILPCDVDWRNPARNKRNLNAVTPVKTQGKCGESHCVLLAPAALFRCVQIPFHTPNRGLGHCTQNPRQLVALGSLSDAFHGACAALLSVYLTF